MTDDGMDPAALNVEPDFSEKIEVPKLAVQIVFDALVQSMDFGSGFLDTEDVHGLREIATALGVDPNKATPDDFRKDFPHPFKRQMRYVPAYKGVLAPTESVLCDTGSTFRKCDRPESDPIHEVGA